MLLRIEEKVPVGEWSNDYPKWTTRHTVRPTSGFIHVSLKHTWSLEREKGCSNTTYLRLTSLRKDSDILWRKKQLSLCQAVFSVLHCVPSFFIEKPINLPNRDLWNYSTTVKLSRHLSFPETSIFVLPTHMRWSIWGNVDGSGQPARRGSALVVVSLTQKVSGHCPGLSISDPN